MTRAAIALALSPGRLTPARRDRVLPAIVVVSLLAHAGLILPMLLFRDRADPPPREIPVDLVQLPPPPAAKPPSPKPQPAEKPAPRQAEQKKPAQPKTAEQKAAAEQERVAKRMQDLLGMPAVAIPGSSDNGSDNVSYRQLVLSRVAKAKPEGRSRGIPGAASVSFTIGDDGEVTRVEVVRKSVDPKLDAEAMAMIQRGVPYPAPPAGAEREFVVTLRFATLP